MKTKLRNDGEGLHSRLFLLVVDKLVLSLALLLVAISVQKCWHDRQTELRQVELAGDLMPYITDSGVDPNQRALLLQILAGANAVSPEVAAAATKGIIDDGVDWHRLVQAAGDSAKSGVFAFVDEAKVVVEQHRRQPGGTRRSFGLWKELFGHVLEELDEEDKAFDQLNNERESARGERFKTLGFLIGSLDRTASGPLFNSRMLAIRRIGHLAVLGNEANPNYRESLLYVRERLSRRTSADWDERLLWQELRLLANIREAFEGSLLSGEIAVPVAEVLVGNTSIELKYAAHDALVSMFDCGIEAEGTIVSYLRGQQARLSVVGYGVRDSGLWHDIMLVADVGVGMGSDSVRAVLHELNELPAVRARRFDLLNGKHCGLRRHGTAR